VFEAEMVIEVFVRIKIPQEPLTEIPGVPLGWIGA
jgi:hypothetical protein